MELTQSEQDLVDRLGFDPQVALLLKQHVGGIVEQSVSECAMGDPQLIEGLSVVITRDRLADRERLLEVLDLLQPLLREHDCRAFKSTRRAPNGLVLGDEVIVLPTLDSFAILEIQQPDGGNYDVFTQDIVRRLREWERRCSFEIVGAASDWVELRFHTLPEHLCRFAEEVYQFCPDTVDQGVGLTEEADEPEVFAAARELCPEISEEARQGLSSKGQILQSLMPDLPPALRQLAALSDSMAGTSPEMGIKLLAYHLQQTHRLFLWWD